MTLVASETNGHSRHLRWVEIMDYCHDKPLVVVRRRYGPLPRSTYFVPRERLCSIFWEVNE